VRDSAFLGIGPARTRRCAVHVRESDDVTVARNSIDSADWYGVFVEQSARARVHGNVVRRPGKLQPDGGPTVTGIELVSAPGSVVTNNRVSECGGYGVAVAACASRQGQPVRVEGNTVADCGDPGLTVQRSRNVSLAHNRVSGASWGFTIGEDNAVCEHVVVTGNSFGNCPYGGGYVRGSSHCEVTGNTFTACGDDPRVQDRGDAIIVLWDAVGRRGVTSSAVTDNTATVRRARPAGGPPPAPPSRFVRSGGSAAFPSRHARGVRVRRNRFVG
jgi:parallel beta-helix repeat protein